MVNYVSAAINLVNIALTFGLLFYTLRIGRIFKGSKLIGKTTPIFTGAAFFLFLAAVFRAALVWGYFTSDLEPLELGTRTIGFILLFVFALSYVRAWTTIGK